ncbi:MAG: purine-nucleoside phosphorylase [Victivallales bacterium]|jgi:purine-nucleoside phosphorylase|nr:purine-nucleoside phosphorylase [Victivallales bacterium]MBT7298457.1 purine-nucleoside phosphorylase [Victivallales bacterium]
MTTVPYYLFLEETASFLRPFLDPCPDLVIVTGTGLGHLAGEGAASRALDYTEIPHFPRSTVPGHKGRLICTQVGGRDVVVLHGRSHMYEGYSAREVVFPLRSLFRCGVRGMVVTNAAGGLDLSYCPGDLMLIKDHINAMGDSCLAGLHDDRWGPRFPDMSRAYDAEVRSIAAQAARDLGIGLHQGVYLAVRGPNLETPAETRFYRQAGADAIGMSTVQETMAAVQAGVKVLGISCITNVNDPDQMAPATHAGIVATAEDGAGNLGVLLGEVCARWPK